MSSEPTTVPSTMTAFVLRDHGAAPVFETVPVPVPEAHEILVRVEASSVNPHDVHLVSGAARAYMGYVFPVVLGTDLAGTAVATGAGVTDIRPGQRVFGMVRDPVAHRGSFAEYVALGEEFVHPAPARLSTEECGVLGLGALTALRCLDAAGVRTGQSMLINGASGGVGTYLVQMAAAAGLRVVATATGAATELLGSLGASDVVDWRTGDLTAEVLRRSGRVDAVVDLVTWDPVALAALAAKLVRPGGRVCSTLNATELLSDLDVASRPVVAMSDPAALARITAQVDEGTLTPVISSGYRFDEVTEAFAALADGPVGKLSITTEAT